MRNPRINVNDETWAKVRGTAAAQNTTVSSVVETALDQYLSNRYTSMMSGSLAPEFTGAVSSTTTTSHTLAETLSTLAPGVVIGKEFHPVPKPKKR